MITEKDILNALSKVEDPEIHKDIVSLGFVHDIKINGNDVEFWIRLTTPACPLKNVIKENSEKALKETIPEIGKITLHFDARVASDQHIQEKISLPVKNVIAVSSGKGGVGKSTVSVNIAASLQATGARTGILDADIYGPNIPRLLGITQADIAKGEKLDPVEKFGMQIMSMGFLIPPGQALMWRGPMLHSVLSQLFNDVNWGELDYLIVDLPPGTGDAQISVAQLVPLTGGIVVTTPQQVSLDDARRGAEAFVKLETPLLGVVENLSGPIFGEGGGEMMAEELKAPFLGRVPMDQAVAATSDEGTPLVCKDPEHPLSLKFKEIAGKIAGAVSVRNMRQSGKKKLFSASPE